MALSDIRCSSCSKLLLKADGKEIVLVIKCQRCGTITEYKFSAERQPVKQPSAKGR